MTERLDDLLARIQHLKDEVEETYGQARQEWEQQRQIMAGEWLRLQKRYKLGLWPFLRKARPLVVITAPIIYLGWIPFLLMDLFMSLYQMICFPVYGIPKVRRSKYVIFGREDLPYLNLIEKFNCFYCSYGNGVAAYTREVAARTEQYWCPIKYARRIASAHDHYPAFTNYGDAEAWHQELARLRQELAKLHENKQ